MKSHLACALAWIEQRKPSGKASNMYYDGDTIFSYGRHFAIATLRKTPNGETVALFTKHSYSISTSRHKSLVRLALHRANVEAFTVPCLDPRKLEDHVTNWTYMIQRAEESERKAKRARKYRDSHYADAAKWRSDAGRYWRTFDDSPEWQVIFDANAA